MGTGAAIGATACLLVGGLAPAAQASRAGSLDGGFGHHGVATLGTGTKLLAIAVQRNGDPVEVGEAGIGKRTRLLVARFTANGRLDRHFGHRGITLGPVVRTGGDAGSLGRAVAVQGNGKVVVVGKATNFDGSARDGLLVERFNANGSLDRHFGSHGVVRLLTTSFGDGYGVALAPHGKIIATGSSDAFGSGGSSFPRVAVARLNGNGSLDRHFGSHGISVIDLGPFSYALAAASAPGGKVVIAGSQSPGLQVVNALVARLTSSGRLDHSFNHSGSFAKQYGVAGGANSGFSAVAVHGGKIVAAGSASADTSNAYAFVARFTGSGRPDGSFGSHGAAYAVAATSYLSSPTTPGANGLAIAPGGKIVLGGQYNVGVESSLALWEFTPSGHPNRRFGSHGTAILKGKTGWLSEAAGVAVGKGGAVFAAGDQHTLTNQYNGLIARYAS